jgi:glycosyltransferase involved in cell wall biosynthesis
MKIAIDIRVIGKKRTGDEAVFFNLVKNLALIDAENEYLLLTDRSVENDLALKGSIALLNLPKNFSLVSLRENGTNKFFWNAWVLPRYLRNNPADILQVQYITPFFVPKKIRIATIVHDVSFKVYPRLIGMMDRFFLNTLMPMSFKRADRIIGVSKFTAQEIVRHYDIDPGKVDWVHNAVGDNFSEKISSEKMEEVRKKYDLPRKFILYIGTLQPRKNLPALIEAYVKLPVGKRDGIKLVLAGGKSHNFDQEIERYIEDYSLQDHVFMPGFIAEEDKPALFKSAHVFCFPSLYEGFGIPILEAMTLGVPTLASRIPPHLEVAGNSILFFDPGKAQDFTDRLAEASFDESLRGRLSENERIQAEKFSWHKTAQKMLEIYLKMADDRRIDKTGVQK